MVLHGEGSLEAQRMTIFAEARAEIQECKKLAEELAGIK
jgi:hypothetical protein